MKFLEKVIEGLNEEIDGAKEYAEKYVENMAKGNTSRANKYKEMAGDELKHAGYMRDFAIADIDELKRVYHMTENEEEMWEHAHKKLMNEMALVRYMLGA
jgi:hypothetical protein